MQTLLLSHTQTQFKRDSFLIYRAVHNTPSYSFPSDFPLSLFTIYLRFIILHKYILKTYL